MPDGTKLSELTEITTIADADLLYVSTSGGLSRRITRANLLDSLALSGVVLTTPQINDASADQQYVFGVSELAADRTVMLPLLTGNDTFVFAAHAETLTNKTINGESNTLSNVPVTLGVAINGGTANRVLYEDSGNLLAESPNFSFDGNSVVLAGSNVVRLTLNANAAQSANLLEAYNATSALRAKITSSGNFSNTGGQTTAEVFGSGASVSGASSAVFGQGATGSGTNASVFGQGASASTDATAVGQGASGGANSAIAIGHGSSVSSTSGIAIGVDASGAGNSIALGRGAANTAANQLVVGSSTVTINSVFIGNGVTNAAPAVTIIRATGGSGTNIAGGNLRLIGGISTGSATPSGVVVMATAAIGSGTTAQTSFEAVTINGAGLTVTANYGAAVVRLTVNAHASQTANLAEWYNGSAAIRAVITAAGEFSNTGGQTNSEIFGNGAAVSDVGGTALGRSASAVGNSVALGFGATTTAAGQFVVGSSSATINEFFLGNGVTSSAPAGAKYRTTRASGTNIAGADTIFSGGQSTGTGSPGALNFQVAIADAGSGSTINGLSTALSLSANTTAQLIGFFGATAVAQPAALTVQQTGITHTAPGTPDYAIQNLTDTGGFGFVTQDEGNTVLQVLANLQARVQELEDAFSATAGGLGLIA